MKYNVRIAVTRRGEGDAGRQGGGPHQQALRLREEPPAAEGEEAVQGWRMRRTRQTFHHYLFQNILKLKIPYDNFYLRQQVYILQFSILIFFFSDSEFENKAIRRPKQAI